MKLGSENELWSISSSEWLINGPMRSDRPNIIEAEAM
jgi:hypothetical protein